MLHEDTYMTPTPSNAVTLKRLALVIFRFHTKGIGNKRRYRSVTTLYTPWKVPSKFDDGQFVP